KLPESAGILDLACSAYRCRDETRKKCDATSARAGNRGNYVWLTCCSAPRHEGTTRSQPSIRGHYRSIIGAFFDVHRELGHGFSELVYRRAEAMVLRQSGLDVT